MSYLPELNNPPACFFVQYLETIVGYNVFSDDQLQELLKLASEASPDSRRLDWLLNHQCDPCCVSGVYSLTWFVDNPKLPMSECFHYQACGKDFRECIDNALAGRVEKFL